MIERHLYSAHEKGLTSLPLDNYPYQRSWRMHYRPVGLWSVKNFPYISWDLSSQLIKSPCLLMHNQILTLSKYAIPPLTDPF